MVTFKIPFNRDNICRLKWRGATTPTRYRQTLTSSARQWTPKTIRSKRSTRQKSRNSELNTVAHRKIETRLERSRVDKNNYKTIWLITADQKLTGLFRLPWTLTTKLVTQKSRAWTKWASRAPSNFKSWACKCTTSSSRKCWTTTCKRTSSTIALWADNKQ